MRRLRSMPVSRAMGPSGSGGEGQASAKVVNTGTTPKPIAPGTLTLGRGRWTGTAITAFEDLFTAVQANVPSRILFGRDGMVYMSVAVGDPPEAARAQDPNDLSGKILRLRDDGKVPPDNPFVGRAGYRPEIYTMGHRMPLGLAIN